MKEKQITVEQFSEMMKGVFQLKEHAMMQQAETRHNKQQMISPWQDGAVPGEANSHIAQPQFPLVDGLSVKSLLNTAGLSGSGPQQLPGMPPPPPPAHVFNRSVTFESTDDEFERESSI